MNKPTHAELTSPDDFRLNHIIVAVITLVVYPFWALVCYLSKAPLGVYPALPVGAALIILSSMWARWRVERKERKQAEQK